MSTALLAKLKAVFTDGSTPVVSHQLAQPLALAQFTAGHILIECVNEDGTAHSLAYDTLLFGVRQHPTDAEPAISVQASNLDVDDEGAPADNWARVDLVPGHWLDVPPRMYAYDVVALVGGDSDDRLPVVPSSHWKTTAENVHPGDIVQVPDLAQPLAQGPKGDDGADGTDGLPGVAGAAGDIQPVGTAAAAGATGKYADAGHVHLDRAIGGVAGSYTAANITVDAYGRITAADNGPAGGASGTLANGATWELATDGINFFKLDPVEPDSPLWIMGFAKNANTLGTRKDNVFGIRVNVGGNGIVDPTKGYAGWIIEDYFVNEFDDPQGEMYWEAGPPVSVGAGSRPIAYNFSHTTPQLTKLLMHAHTINVGAGVGPSAGQVQLDISDDTITLRSPNGNSQVAVKDTEISIAGPSNDSSGTQTLKLYEADPIFAGVMARFGGGVTPQGDANFDLGYYSDSPSKRQRWKRIAARHGQFIAFSLLSPSREDVGSFTTLWDADQLTDQQPYVQLGDPVGNPAWYRLPTARALAADADTTPIASATTIAPQRPIVTVTGTTTVQTITVLDTLAAGGIQTIIPTGALPFGTSGNIGAAFIAVAGVPVICVWDGSKWWLR